MLVENVRYHRYSMSLVVAGRRLRRTVWSPGTPYLGHAVTGILNDDFPEELAAGEVRVVSVREWPYRPKTREASK